jgi:Histidine kinase-, DNA gyrase B-, and HSP90-like ATPase
MPPGRPARLSRRLLRVLSISDLRRVVDHYGLPRARTHEQMVAAAMTRVGSDLTSLVSHTGPLTLAEWNLIASKLGGQARRSFEDLQAELAFRLDPVAQEFDLDQSVAEVREDARAVRRLADLLKIDTPSLQSSLQTTHGRTLLSNFVSQLRAESATALDEDDDADVAEGAGPDESGPALSIGDILRPALTVTDAGSGSWPTKGRLTIHGQAFDVAIYARRIGGSARGRNLERRLQNPAQGTPIVDDPNRHELLFGIWQEQGPTRAVIVAFDPYRRMGRTTRFSMFMPLSLLEEAADTGFATHENATAETLYAFRPENIDRYVQGMIEEGFWSTSKARSSGHQPTPSKTAASVRTAAPASQLNIRPQVGMYAAFARLNYKPWFALAEFIDNSIQSFLSNQQRLAEAGHAGPLVIDVNIDDNEIAITDRAGGIAWADFPRAFSPATPPADASGLSEFGLGMKAAACWFAKKWTVRTSALGEPMQRTVTFDIPSIMRSGTEVLPIEATSARENDHFTVVTLTDLRVRPKGRTLAKIKEHLQSIYRVLMNDGVVKLRVTTAGSVEELTYDPPKLLDAPYYKTPKAPSQLWRQPFEVDFGDRTVTGWAGILERGSHVHAGFSVFRRRRLIEGSVGETYKPSALFGTPNSFASQRVIGEMFVEGFDVSHTKDGIQWGGYEDELLDKIYRQINSPDCPLLTQADGYRARTTAAQLPKNFGANALSDATDAIAEADTSKAIGDVACTPPVVELSLPPAPPEVVLQQREHVIDLPWEGTSIRVVLQLVQDQAADFFVAAVEKNAAGEEVLTVRLNLDHRFSIAFVNDNEQALQPILRLVAALALSERMARKSGVSHASVVRSGANKILNALSVEYA